MLKAITTIYREEAIQDTLFIIILHTILLWLAITMLSTTDREYWGEVLVWGK